VIGTNGTNNLFGKRIGADWARPTRWCALNTKAMLCYVKYSSTQLPGSRVLADRYGASFSAMAVPKGHAGRLAYVSEFIEAAKASGLVQRALERDGQGGVQVAPPGNRN